jgi:BirA family biotin operon repressor/biotin-[acetyl-CoA-carboxylase] ligase
MTETPTLWGAEALWEQLEPLLPGISVEVVARSPSTNSALLERARVSVGPGGQLVQVRPSVESGAFGRRAADMQPCLLVAEHQTGGRGRMGRAWKAVPGASLTFSLSLPLDPPDWSGLSLAVGAALADAIDPSDGLARPWRVGLKWPNDLWLLDAETDSPASGRKLGGILIETVTAGVQRLAVIGIGLNVLPLQTNDLRSGFACVQELDPATTVPKVLHAVALPLVQTLLRFNREGFAPFAADFTRRDLLRGHAVVTTQADLPEGVARGVTNSGALRVDTPTGPREVSSGEVSVRLEGTPPDTASGTL